MNLDSIARAMKEAFNKMKTPAEVLPATLLYCTAMKRPGISASETAAKIIADNAALGIETGLNPDGSENVVNQYTYNLTKHIFDEIKRNAVVQVAIPVGSIMVEATGANAGGPVVCVGSNKITTTLKGIIR